MRVKLIFTHINTWKLFLKNENPPNVVVAKPQRVRDAIYAILDETGDLTEHGLQVRRSDARVPHGRSYPFDVRRRLLGQWSRAQPSDQSRVSFLLLRPRGRFPSGRAALDIRQRSHREK